MARIAAEAGKAAMGRLAAKLRGTSAQAQRAFISGFEILPKYH